MEITATAKNIRVSPEKVRLVVAQIKKMSPSKAVLQLDFINKSSALPLKKVISSAIANAKNNFGLEEASLAIKSILVGKGIVFKRYRPVARGRAHHILKRTSHIKVILEGEQAKKVSKISEVSQVAKGESKNDKHK